MPYLHVAWLTFRRYATYRSATLAGIVANAVFGIIASFTLLAVWRAQPTIGGYEATDAVTYVWLGQALLMSMQIWGGGAPQELAQRIRTGDVTVDLCRPTSLLGWYLAADLGRTCYSLLSRGVPPTVMAAVLFDLRFPAGPLVWLTFFAAVLCGALVSYALRTLVALMSFWLLDTTGVQQLMSTLGVFFSGLIVPLVLFPDLLGDVAAWLPWVALLQIPADIWLGQLTGREVDDAMLLSVMWAAVLLVSDRLLLQMAVRRLVVQGG